MLAVAPRDAVDEPLRQLAAWGAQASAVLVADDTTDNVPLNLLPDELRKKSNAMRLPYLNTALAAGAAILFCVALALPIWQKRATVLALHPLLGQAHEQAEAAETLRRQLEALIAEYNYLIDKKRESPPVVAVLDDITRILPDDTWVQQFELKGNEVQIYGETASSSKLAGLFEQSKTLHDASFRAPLTKGQAANSERFQLAAEIKPLPRTAAGHQPAHLAQPAVAQPAADPATLPSQSAIPALPEKDHKSDKQPHEAVKADSKPAAATSGTGSGQAPAARGEKQR
ncbi:MAG: hypothetical protein A2Z65_01395 [Gallionellales bacterium RIFCSPLOWO2_02_58_13]|nr:MAG: hypothetical protein A2Z65_01395 [Gallionellales bacterium RIFCSPLOWO2_02_58_13]